MSNESIIILSASLISGFVVFVWFLNRQRAESSTKMEEIGRQIVEAQQRSPALEFLQREVNNLREQMTKSLAESARLVTDSQKSIGERLDRAADVVGKVQKSL